MSETDCYEDTLMEQFYFVCLRIAFEFIIIIVLMILMKLQQKFSK